MVQEMTAPTPTNSSNSGVAGRTDYGTWDKITKDLVDQQNEEEQAEIQEQKKLLGHDKYALSKDHKLEQEKFKKVKQTKKKLDGFKKREEALVSTISNVFNETTTIKRITQHDLQAGERVLRIVDCHGTSTDMNKLVITQDLSNLESQMTTNPQAKQYPQDAENDAANDVPRSTTIKGLVKVFLDTLSNCTVIVKAKIITNTIEVHHCKNVNIVVEHYATVATVQLDMSENVSIKFDDAPSGKSTAQKFVPWGDDGDDRIFHAGCTNLSIALYRDGLLYASTVCHYLKDGAAAAGNAAPEEFQFVTTVRDETLVTEAVVRTATNTNVRAMTKRELQEAEQRKAQITSKAVELADSMVSIKDKEGNVLVTKKEEPTIATKDPNQSIMDEINQLKARGNEAFGAGEYAQAVLHYSLGIDKTAELTSNANYRTEVLYTNRAAAFLKLGNHDKAVADADAALQVNPHHLKALFRKGLALHAAKKYQEALPVLAEAYKLEPHNKQIHQALQFCEVRLQTELRQRMNQ